MTLAREYGAAVICLLIDERGQARDVEWKMEIAHRIHEIATERYGLAASDLIFDALTFPLSTGDDDLRKDAIYTMEAIRRIKAEIPGAHTTLGVSNVSFGLNPPARHALNSVFLHECVQAGLDSAIVHAGKIVPLNRLPDDQREVCLDLVYDRRTDTYDPLQELLEVFADVKSTKTEKVDRSGQPVAGAPAPPHHRRRPRRPDRPTSTRRWPAMPALAIVNDVLLGGMKVVGELFGSGQMQLPFVLQSAETMKTAVAYLEPHMEKVGGSSAKGKLVLATVKGDVHDIGKNLVDIICTNNGYEVHNLGIKVAIGEMVAKVKEVDADAIGMSGLLVKSTLIMRENLEELNYARAVRAARAARRRRARPAATSSATCARSTTGACSTAATRSRGCQHARLADDDEAQRRVGPGVRHACRPAVSCRSARSRRRAAVVELPRRSPDVATDNPVFTPPFVGARVVKGIPLDDIAEYVNETALFRNQWQFRPEKLADGEPESDDEFKARIRPIFREQLAAAKASGVLVPQVVYGYFPANGDGDDLVVWTDESRIHRGGPLPLPAPEGRPVPVHRRLLPPDRVGRGRLRRLPHRHDGRRGQRGDGPAVRRQRVPAVPAAARPRRRDGRGTGRVLAPPHPRGVGLRRRGRSDDRRPLPPAVPRRPLLVGLPGVPGPRGQRARSPELLDADRLGIEVSEETGWQYQPEQTTSAIICHHPQAKYFIAR